MSSSSNLRKFLFSTVASSIIGLVALSTNSYAVVPNDNNTSDEIVDEDGGVNGVGIFYANGICTGTLINPRTVIFAAHCVNYRAASDYGTSVPAAFAFQVNSLPGLQNWFANNFTSNPELFVYNVNEIIYNEDSLRTGFLEGDVALASLDTPAANVPTWALLFSPLPTPLGPGDTGYDPALGTGYHVNITGYGRSGIGSQGSIYGIDWRRRAAENMLGALTSLDASGDFLYGGGSGLPQNLYLTDFDDPDQTNIYDMNVYQDNALPNEGTTAGGDSGGPLILDAENNVLTAEDLVLGVLSGGSRYFNGQVFSSYGGSSFYQPLFLFSDYIAANNPYRYVSTLEGDGDWEDPLHWQTDLDPNYRIIDSSGSVVNGFPETTSFGVEDSGNSGFGVICTDFTGDNSGDACRDISTGNPAPPSRNGGTNGIISNEINANLESQSGGDPLPSPTIDNGLAGATNFIPDNIDLAPGLNGRRYFEVSMSNAGITTLSSTRTIDRLNVGGNAELVIGSAGNLTSLMDINQTGGHISVDGALNSIGDYTLFFGYLTGAGILNSPFLTNIAGTIAPGDIGNIETLTIDGSAVLSSGSSLMIDIGSNGLSDVLSITGDASLGGTVFFNPNLEVRSGNTYTFLTTSGLQSGELSAENISSILTPVLTHDINSVTALIEAGSYNNAISASNSIHASYAKLLDSNRDLGGLDSVYATLDLSSDSQIQDVLTSWAPEAEMTVRSLAKATTDALSQFHSSRLRIMETGSWSGGSISVMGSLGKIASHQDAIAPMSNVVVSDMDNEASIKTNKKIADDYSIYLAGSFIDGNASVMPFSSNLEKEHFDGWTLSAGIEHAVSENIKLGASLSYTDLSLNDQAAKSVNSNHAAVTLYGQLQSKSNLVLSGQFSIGSFDTSTERNIVFPASYSLYSEDENLSVTSKVQLSRPLKMSDFTVIPKMGLQTAMVDFNDVLETGGVTALNIDRKYYSSTQGRLGLDIVSNKNSNFYWRISGDVVNEFDDSLNMFRAGFAQSNGEHANFLLAGTDQFWGEVGAGIAFEIDKAVMSLSVDTTVGRDDLSTQSYRAGITLKF